MSHSLRIQVASLVLLTLLGSTAMAQGLIDFEVIPGQVPVEGLPISNQFEPTHGVTFSLANGASPVLGEVGAPRTAFAGHLGLPDEPSPGTGVGQFFLTDDGTVVGIPSPLIVSYTTPVGAATGAILDIDGEEEWLIEAFDAAGATIGAVILGPNNTVDGSSSTWSFNVGAPVIVEIRMTFTGQLLGLNVGLAFDRFNAAAVQPGTGQANGPLGRLEVNGVGSGGGNGPFDVAVDGSDSLTFDWEGPPGALLLLAAGPPNPGHTTIPCIGTVDIGTPPLFQDVLPLFNGTVAPYNLFFSLDGAGEATQTFTLPGLPPGPLFAIQGFVFQPGGLPCAVVLTASFKLNIL